MKRVRVIRERKNRNLTQEYVATKVGYKTQSAVSDVENGKLEPSLAVMKKWADLFGMTVDELWFSSGEENGEVQSTHAFQTTNTA